MKTLLYFGTILGKHGLFESEAFGKYMDRFEGAIPVNSNVVVPDCGEGRMLVYHIEPQNIILSYHTSEEGRVSAILSGSQKSIGEVERIIFKAAKRYKLKPEPVTAGR